MKKFAVGVIVGVAAVLIVQSPQMKSVRENVTHYVADHVTGFMDDFVDSYIETRDQIKKEGDI